jgi:L-malate glycosyltransferase
MASSLPVVATNVGGNAEAVKDGISGLLVAPEDPEALSTAIADLLSDPARAKAMGTAGRALVADNFTTEAMMTRITTAYSNLLSPKALLANSQKDSEHAEG